MKTLVILMSLLLLGVGVAMVTAQEKSGEPAMSQEMPPTGAPDEFKARIGMVGAWESHGKMRMDPTTEEWTDYHGEVNSELICDGVAMVSHFKSEMFGMPFVGMSIETYDRETKSWQTTWLDNFGARQSMYVGKEADGKIVFTGEDMMQGQTFKTRITVSNLTDTSYDWMLEHSMDGGATWAKYMDAKYTKKM